MKNTIPMEQGYCPCCGKNTLDYGNIAFYDDQAYFPRECTNCGADGEERYQLEFIEHYVVSEGEKQNKEKAD